MNRIRPNKTWSSLALAAAVSLGVVAPAQAKLYVGSWDPNYGGIFSDLGWRGSVEVFAPDACLGLTGLYGNADSPCGGGEMAILAAKVELYDVGNPDVVLQTMNFNPSSTGVTGMTFEFIGPALKNTRLVGLETGFFAPIKGSIAQAQYEGSDYWWHLGFTGDKALMAYTRSSSTSPSCAFFGNTTSCGLQDYANFPTNVTFVPEPETYALMLAGLVAVGFVARRRRAQGQGAAAGSASASA
jgi:hypothetical protein